MHRWKALGLRFKGPFRNLRLSFSKPAKRPRAVVSFHLDEGLARVKSDFWPLSARSPSGFFVSLRWQFWRRETNWLIWTGGRSGFRFAIAIPRCLRHRSWRREAARVFSKLHRTRGWGCGGLLIRDLRQICFC